MASLGFVFPDPPPCVWMLRPSPDSTKHCAGNGFRGCAAVVAGAGAGRHPYDHMGRVGMAAGTVGCFIGLAARKFHWSHVSARSRRTSSRALTDETDLAVSSLLSKYAGAITAIRRVCPDLVQDRDDTYVLRLAIEHQGDTEAAVKNIQKVNFWRRRTGRAIVQAAQKAVEEAQAEGGWNNAPVFAAAPHSALISKYITGSQIVIVNMPNGDLCSCIRASAIDDEKLMDAVTVEQMIEFFLYAREVNFLVAQKRTRESGQLIKLIAANDLTGVSKLPDGRFQEALTKSSEQATLLYPGFAGPTAILNIPDVARFVLQFLTPLFPGAVQQRLKFAQGPMAYIKDLTDVLREPTKSTFVDDLQAVLR